METFIQNLLSFFARSKKIPFYCEKLNFTYKYQIVDDIPISLSEDRIYIVGESNFFWCAIFICPCGCNEKIQLNLLREARPRWTVRSIKNNDIATLSPSIWRNIGCRSHFFIKRGYVIWCDKNVFIENL